MLNPLRLTPLRLTHAQIESKLDRILLKVQKPGRYVGGELNSVVKDWDKVSTKVAFVFPDIYDIGVSNVGLKILYDQVNQREDALAERAYAPWLDLDGIPVRATERDESHPLIIAGGHSTMNPEPMHAFIDAFVIGEGEEVIHDIINTIQGFKGKRKDERSDLY